MKKLKMAPRIVAPYTCTICVRVHVCDLDRASIHRKGMFAF